MKLSVEGIKNRAAWLENGIRLPEFDIAAVREETVKNPEWVHFGAGNIFRGFIGSISQSLLNQGLSRTGIIAVESFDFDIIDRIYTPFDSLTLNVLMGKELDMEVLAGIACGVKATDYDRLYDIAVQPSLKMISFTITEKGYAVKGADGKLMGIAREHGDNARHDLWYREIMYAPEDRGVYTLLVNDNHMEDGELYLAAKERIGAGEYELPIRNWK